MLKGIDPILSPDLLSTLRAMGHGDEIAIVDGNYPGVEHARRLIRLDGVALIPALNAVLSVMPIDDFVEEAIFRSTFRQERDTLEPVQRQGQMLGVAVADIDHVQRCRGGGRRRRGRGLHRRLRDRVRWRI